MNRAMLVAWAVLAAAAAGAQDIRAGQRVTATGKKVPAQCRAATFSVW